MVANGGLGTPDPSARGLDEGGVVLAAASTVPLLLRRRAPGTTFAVTAVATLAMLYLRYPLDVPLGAAASAYGLSVRYGDYRAGRRWLAPVAVLAFMPLVAAIYAAAGVRVWNITPELLGWLGIFLGIWFAGDRTRLRREQVEHLRERIRRAEHDAERDRRLAAAEERTRIARELHDSAGHAINVILVQAGAARLLHERNPQASRAAIATIEDVARTTIGEIDRLVRALRDDAGAEPAPADPGALQDLIDRHRAAGLAIATHLEAPPASLPNSVAWATYRIVQEGLTNAARHGCGRAELAVRSRPDGVEISVTNPVGARSLRPAAGGHGIVGMRERATLLGGTLETTEDAGTFRLRARLPLDGARA
jgi:signal transduction histidine kinase